MNFFELLLAIVSIVMFLFSLLVLFWRNNSAMLKAMFIPDIFLEDIIFPDSIRLSQPANKAIGVSESIQSRKEVRLKKNFSVRFGLMLFVTSLALMYFAIY